MSYDVYVHEPGLDPDDGDGLYDTCIPWVDYVPAGLGESPCRGVKFNYTYNVRKLFHRFNVCPKDDLDGLTGRQAARRITRALDAISRTPRHELDALTPTPNPEAGRPYGTWQGAVNWLQDIRTVCHDHPDWVVSERS